MSDAYIFKGNPEPRVYGPLPEGDYNFKVAECGEPYQKVSGNWVLAVKLTIQPSGQTVFANPWSGVDKNGDQRDGIGEFLVSCDRAPKPGTEPDWRRVVGAYGRCKLKIEIAKMGSLAGKEVNKVGWFHAPEQVGPNAEQAPRQSYSQEEYNQARRQQEAKTAGPDDLEPTDIPF